MYGKSTHGAHHAARVVVRIKLWREEGSKKWVSCESLKLLHGVKPRMCWPSQTSVLLSHCLAGKPAPTPTRSPPTRVGGVAGGVHPAGPGLVVAGCTLVMTHHTKHTKAHVNTGPRYYGSLRGGA